MKLVTHAMTRCVINVVREDEGWHGFCKGICETKEVIRN